MFSFICSEPAHRIPNAIIPTFIARISTFTLEAMQSASLMRCRLFVEAGSLAEYGIYNTIITEESPYQPVTEYGKAKLAVKEAGTKLSEKLSIKYLLLLIFSTYGDCICSSADIIPYAVTHHDQIRPWSHTEWYCNRQYSAPTTYLFRGYNQTIPAWICAALLVSTQLFCFSPFPFIGFVLYVAIEHGITITQRLMKTRSVSRCISDEFHELFLHRQWMYCCVGCIFAYMTASFMGCTGRDIEIFFFHRFSIFRYLIFCLTEFAIPCLLMLKYRYKVREVSVIICMLATLPFFQIISFDDYVMRVSIIPLLMMCVIFFSFIM